MMTRSTSLRFSPLWLLAFTMTCSDPSTSARTEPPAVPLPKELAREFEAIVSDPIAVSAAQVDAAASLNAGSVYVSLAPQTIPRGQTLRVRHLGTGAQRTANLVDGGRDPVAVGASVGDTLSLVATDSSGATKTTTLIVSSRRPPRIVRTIPPRRKADVPVNARITIVFSEPIAPAALTANAIRLQQGEAPVVGELELQPDQLTVTFTPSTDLAPSTDYELIITQAIVDVQGDALESTTTIQFRTIDPPRPPPLEIVVQTVTTGTDLDPDGYYLGVTNRGWNPERVALNATVTMSPGQGTWTMPPDAVTWTIWLADVDPNCSVDDNLRTVSGVSGQRVSIVFTISCSSLSERVPDPLAGVFEMVRWEFFRDSAMTDRYDDVFSGGRLMFRSVADGSYFWQWNPAKLGDTPYELMGGVASLNGNTLSAGQTRVISWVECDIADCGGPLHGPGAPHPSDAKTDYAVVRNGTDLILSGPTDCYFTSVGLNLYGCKSAWTRMSLRRVR